MGTAATTANVPQLLKDIWQDEIFDFQYEDMPFYGQVEKDSTWDGVAQDITVQYGGMPGRSNTIGDAYDNQGPPKYAQMRITTSDNFAIWSVDHKLITLSRNKRGALVKALAENTEKAQTKIKRNMGYSLWRNGGGAIAQIDSSAFGGGVTVITLKDPNDIRNIDLDDVLQHSAADGTSGAVTATSKAVTVVDEDAGTITVAGDVTAEWLDDGFLFHKGDFGKAFYGVAAYCPLSAPGTGGVPVSIWSMSRAAHLTRLGGHRFTATTADLIEETKLALTKAYRRSCDVNKMFTCPEAFNEIESSLQGQRRYVDVKVGRVGFQGLEFTSQSGKVIQLFSDPDVPKSSNGKRLLYGINMDHVKLHTALEFPMWLTIDGKQDFFQHESLNQSQGRVGGYGQFYSDAPGQLFVLEFTT